MIHEGIKSHACTAKMADERVSRVGGGAVKRNMRRVGSEQLPHHSKQQSSKNEPAAATPASSFMFEFIADILLFSRGLVCRYDCACAAG